MGRREREVESEGSMFKIYYIPARKWPYKAPNNEYKKARVLGDKVKLSS